MEKKETLKKIISRADRYVFFISPFIVLGLMLLMFASEGAYPFGDRSISWCDMNQQVIPLFNQFKDILSGKASFTYNLENAGGMSFFGIFFFFLSSPFTLLCVFVNKVDMMSFMNILVMLKMMVCSLTIGIYLRRKYKNLNWLVLIGLSLMYAFSGYIMMYYQNVIWLDLVYLFPLLMMSVDHLLKKGRVIPYIVMTSLYVMINYYLGIMVMIYIIMYVGVNLFIKRHEENAKQVASRFILGSIIAALISMIVLIPSFVDYINSARTVSIFESLKNSWVITSYVTTIPLVLSGLVLFPFFFSNKKDNGEKKIKIFLLILMSIPLVIEPINKMWHYGSYQAFPCRFAFINIFLILDILSISLEDDTKEKLELKTLIRYICGVIVTVILLTGLFIFKDHYVENKQSNLIRYASTLWGNDTSFEALLRYYGVVLVFVMFVYIFHRFKLVPKHVLGVFIMGLSILDATFSFKVYMPNPQSTENYREYYELENLIDDDSFYRVSTKEKILNVNDLGGLGYPTLGHYTSLTSSDYMDSIKRMGYSSYWMEVGTYGGTKFTNALLENKYTIIRGKNSLAKYQTDNYSIVENEVFPLGIVSNNKLDEVTDFSSYSRVQYQEYIYHKLFDENNDLHTVYSYSSLSNVKDNSKDGHKIFTTSSGTIEYNITVNEKTTLYFEAIGTYEPVLKQNIHESMSIYCNGKVISPYPSQARNGVIELGTFENRNVNIKINLSKSIDCLSFDVYGLNDGMLESALNNVRHGDVTYTNNTFKGNYYLEEDEGYIFLPLFYNKSIRAKLNGHYIDATKVFGDLVAFKLEKGNNNFELVFVQQGLPGGIMLSVLGIGLFGAFIYFDRKKKLNFNKVINNISFHLVLCLTGVILIAVYILPIIINVIGQM